MPSDDRPWFDNNESRAPLGPEAYEADPEESVPSSKFGPTGNGTSQDDDLVSQGGGSRFKAQGAFESRRGRLRLTRSGCCA